MKFKKDFFNNYLKEAPVPLAIERTLECNILAKKEFIRPILDIGCGEGLFAYILFDEKIDVGVEPNLKEMGRAGEYGMYRELINCYGDQIPKKENSFNTIISNSALEHIPDIGPVLSEVRRLLSVDGRVYLTLPTNYFDKYTLLYSVFSFFGMKVVAERYRLFFNKFWKHYHYYDKEGWSRLFRENGFEVLEVQEYGNKKICLLNDMLAPFSIMSFISKKLFNRWFLNEKARALYVPLLRAIFTPATKPGPGVTDGGLIFFCLGKRSGYE